MFKKINHNSISKEQTDGDSLNQKINSCIGEIVDLIAVKIGNENREINPRDAILCSGNLVGLFMFLSFNLDYKNLNPDSVLLSKEADELGPKVMNRLIYELSNYGIEIKNIKNDEIYESSLSYLEILNKVQKNAMQIMEKYEFNYEQAYIICISATAFIIQNVSSEIDANEGCGIAIYGIIQGSKTVPIIY